MGRYGTSGFLRLAGRTGLVFINDIKIIAANRSMGKAKHREHLKYFECEE
jgi:hypothetical protein